jgi:hypothetical protein
MTMNSVRELYLPQADAFAGLVSQPRELAPLYGGVAAAVAARDADAAAGAVERLVAMQEELLIR